MKEKGITLIALIITIIVLVTLAAVSINILFDNGIVGYAMNGADRYKSAESEESRMLAEAENLLAQNGNVGSTRESITVDKAEYEQMKTDISILKTAVNTLTAANSAQRYYETTFSNVEVPQSNKKVNGVSQGATVIATITLPAGKYVLTGYSNYQGSDLRWIAMVGSGPAISGYDPSRLG